MARKPAVQFLVHVRYHLYKKGGTRGNVTTLGVYGAIFGDCGCSSYHFSAFQCAVRVHRRTACGGQSGEERQKRKGRSRRLRSNSRCFTQVIRGQSAACMAALSAHARNWQAYTWIRISRTWEKRTQAVGGGSNLSLASGACTCMDTDTIISKPR